MIITEFYRELARGAQPHKALNTAKRKAITYQIEKQGTQYALPYFWAVFDIYMNHSVKIST